MNSMPTCLKLETAGMYIYRELCTESVKLRMIADKSFKTAWMYIKSHNISA
jgi:hypothetical protein